MNAWDTNARLVVAIDGPSGSGKSSVSKEVARRFDLAYLDTGAMYRAVTWWCLESGVDLTDPQAVLPSLRRGLLYHTVVAFVRTDQIVGGGMLAHDPSMRLSIARISFIRPDNAGKLCGTPVGSPGHQRGDRRGQGASAIRIIGVTGGHQQRS